MVEELLTPEHLQQRCGCRVIKHPDCCVRCRTNNSCKEIPMHAMCRCRPEYVCFED
jgi:hypothetical protein